MSIEILLMGIIAIITFFTALYSLMEGRKAFLDSVEDKVESFGRCLKNLDSLKKRFGVGVLPRGYDMGIETSSLRKIISELEKRWVVKKIFYRNLFAKASLLIFSLTKYQEEIRKNLDQLRSKTRVVLEEFRKENYQLLRVELGPKKDGVEILENFSKNPYIYVKINGGTTPLESFIFSDLAVKNVLVQCPVELGSSGRDVVLPTEISEVLREKIVNSFKDDKTLVRLREIAKILDEKVEDLGKEYLKKFRIWASP